MTQQTILSINDEDPELGSRIGVLGLKVFWIREIIMRDGKRLSTGLFGENEAPLDPHVFPTPAELQTADQKRLNEYKRLNLARARKNPNELWMEEKLKALPGYKWTPQARWGRRIYDFWCAAIGVVVEVDGPEHKADYDALRDKFNFLYSGIIILRVRNRNESDAACALDHIIKECLWQDRRAAMGFNVKGYNQKWLRQQLRNHGDLQLGIDKVLGAGLYCSYACTEGSIRQSSSWIWKHNPKDRLGYQQSFL